MDEGSPLNASRARIGVFLVRPAEFAILFKNWLTSKITKDAKNDLAEISLLCRNSLPTLTGFLRGSVVISLSSQTIQPREKRESGRVGRQSA